MLKQYPITLNAPEFLKIFLVCDAGYLCPKLDGVDLNIASMLKRPRPIFDNGFYPTVLWKRYCSKVAFWPLGPTHFATSWNVCNLVPI